MSNKKTINLVIILFLILGTKSSTSALKDVPSGHWAKDAVDEVVNDYGFMQGDPNGHFGGQRSLSRYEFAKTISRMIEYVNEEIDSDRKDLENIVSVMELFQNELKVIETKMNTIQEEVRSQNKAIADINELALTLGNEYTSIASNEQNANDRTVPSASFDARLTQLEYSVDKLQNKGLFIDTLVKGTVNDVKKLGSATSNAFSAARRNVSRRKAREEVEQIQENAQEQVNQTKEQVQNQLESQSDAELYYDYDAADVEVLQEVIE